MSDRREEREQLDLLTDLDAREGLDPWMDSLPCPPWAEDEETQQFTFGEEDAA